MIRSITSDEFPDSFNSLTMPQVGDFLKLNGIEIARVVNYDEDEETILISMLTPMEERIKYSYDYAKSNENDYIFLRRQEVLREENIKICLTKQRLRAIIRKEIVNFVKRNKLKTFNDFANAMNYLEKAKDGKIGK